MRRPAAASRLHCSWVPHSLQSLAWAPFGGGRRLSRIEQLASRELEAATLLAPMRQEHKMSKVKQWSNAFLQIAAERRPPSYLRYHWKVWAKCHRLGKGTRPIKGEGRSLEAALVLNALISKEETASRRQILPRRYIPGSLDTERNEKDSRFRRGAASNVGAKAAPPAA